MSSLKPPEKINLTSQTANVSELWRKFKRELKHYMIAIGIASKDDECKRSTLVYTIGDEGNDIYETFTFEKAGDELIFDKVMQKFELYCTPTKNITLKRFHFNHCVQEKEESSDQLITRLKHLSQTCEFGVLENSLIKDRIVYGIRNDSTRERLLREEDLTLEKADKICRTAEMAKMQINELSSQPKPETVHVVTSTGTRGKKVTKHKTTSKSQQEHSKTKHDYSLTPNPNNSNKKHECRRCGISHISGKCLAYGKDCLRCGCRNHFAKLCLSKRSHRN